MEEIKSIQDMSYNELAELYAEKTQQLVDCEENSTGYNYILEQLDLIEAELEIKRSKDEVDEENKLHLKPELIGLMRASAAAKMLGVHVSTVKRWIQMDIIDGRRIGAIWYVDRKLRIKEQKPFERKRDEKGRFR
jgi:uncharacterized protein YjcR